MTDRSWIRSPLWDSAWILSGLPIGFLLLATSTLIAPPTLFIVGTAVLGFGHVLSPIALAWVHPETRKIALSKRAKFIGVPLAVLAAATAVGLLTSTLPPLSADLSFPSVAVQAKDFRNPMVWLMVVYLLWNGFHFGMQNFGILTIYRIKSTAGRSNQRRWDLVFCLVTIAVVTAIPVVPHLPFRSYLYTPVEWGVVALAIGSSALLLSRELLSGFSLPRAIFILVIALSPMMMLWWGFWATTAARHWPWLMRIPLWPSLWGFALLAVNHWLVSIGLAGHVFSRHQCGSLWTFVGAVTVVGALVFAALFVDLRTLTIRVTAVAISIRLGLGFVHFLYDRWLYKLSDPALRATVGRDLFGQPSFS